MEKNWGDTPSATLKEARWGFPMRYTDDRPHHKCEAETHMKDYDTPEIRCSLRNPSRVTEWLDGWSNNRLS